MSASSATGMSEAGSMACCPRVRRVFRGSMQCPSGFEARQCAPLRGVGVRAWVAQEGLQRGAQGREGDQCWMQ